MKICGKKEAQRPAFIEGNVYQLLDEKSEFNKSFYLAVYNNESDTKSVYGLETGSRRTFDLYSWQDVTDKVCLDVSGVES